MGDNQGTDINTTVDQIVRAYAHCDQIARCDKPHLYAAAQLFPQMETRRAFASTYASMRVIDDFVDDIPDRRLMSDVARSTALKTIDNWMSRVTQAKTGCSLESLRWMALTHTFAQFDLPLSPWEDLATAMKSDLWAPAFQDWNHLRRYMHGASVAPAVVFMYLVLMERADEADRFTTTWNRDEVAAATEDLAIFCYWTHILRDVSIDLATGDQGLVYLPLEDLSRFDLTIDDLRAMQQAGTASDTYRRLAYFESRRARQHLEKGRHQMRRVIEVAPPGNVPALQTLVQTYVAVLEELESRGFDVFSTSLATEKTAF